MQETISYTGLSVDILWSIVINHLPKLKAEVTELLSSLPRKKDAHNQPFHTANLRPTALYYGNDISPINKNLAMSILVMPDLIGHLLYNIWVDNYVTG